MAKIEDVWMDNASCNKETGMGITLNVNFDNRASVTVCLDSKINDPLFADVIKNKNKHCSQPQTDGDRVYWSNGASLTVDEVMLMLQTAK